MKHMDEEDRTPMPQGFDEKIWRKADEMHHAMALVAKDEECVKIIYAALAAAAPTDTERKAVADLTANWESFCDADAFEGSDTFLERMEQAGYIEAVPVTKEALDDPFAYERGIVPGGTMWQLTKAGREAIARAASTPASVTFDT
jgi:hypothetical protein